MSVKIENKVELDKELRKVLLVGRQNALPGRLLAQMLGFRDDRAIRLAIRKLIANGLPVASAVSPPMGFYIANTRQEVEEYLSDLKGRLVEDAYRRRDFKIAARNIIQPEQVRLL